jgi:hypothetical protein
MRQKPATTATAIAALSCDDETCSLAADDVQAFITGVVAKNLLENHEGSSAFHHAKRARYENHEGGERAIAELPSGTEATNRTSIREKRFCTSCKHNLDAMTYFLENRKTCTTCLKKHKLYIYEKRRRRRHPAND